jgi:hypothetical protein
VERIKEFFIPLLERNPSGSDWLPPLLQATPAGTIHLGELADDPSWLHANLTMPALEGRRTCFQYPVAPPPELVLWFIDHPEALRWPPGAEHSPEARLLRRALLYDEPPGARRKAQERARELMRVRSAFAHEWWRFEELHAPDLVLMTDPLVLTFVAASDELPAVSAWYPQRSVLHRALEAAERLAQPGDENRPERAWGTIVLSDVPLPEASAAGLRHSLPAGAPHRDEAGRAELAAGYLGALTWAQAAAAVAPAMAQR